MSRLPCSLMIGAILLTAQSSKAIFITWDYSYDSSGFFTPERRAVMDAVSQDFSQLRIDREAIVPTGTNQWSWNFQSFTGTGETVVESPSVQAGEVRIFVGAQNLGPGILGFGGSVGYAAGGNSAWFSVIQSGNTAEAYKPFGGTIRFNLDADWYSGLSIDQIQPAQFDLYTVASHELGHVLGIGLGVAAWNANINPTSLTFTGSQATSLYGSGIPLDDDLSHIALGTTYQGNGFIMEPLLSSGTRKYWNPVEYSMLLDLGYTAVPEPEAIAMFVAGALVLIALRQRKQ